MTIWRVASCLVPQVSHWYLLSPVRCSTLWYPSRQDATVLRPLMLSCSSSSSSSRSDEFWHTAHVVMYFCRPRNSCENARATQQSIRPQVGHPSTQSGAVRGLQEILAFIWPQVKAVVRGILT